jgi:hypothetical protein
MRSGRSFQPFGWIGVRVSDLHEADRRRSRRKTRHLDPHVDDLGPVRFDEQAIEEAENPRRGQTQNDASGSQGPRRERRLRALDAPADPENDRGGGQGVDRQNDANE